MKVRGIRKYSVILVFVTFLLVFGWAVWHCLKVYRSDGCQPVELDTLLLRTGDLVFRNGRSNESVFVTGVSNGDYSHVGIAYHDGCRWCVIHAVPGEAAEGQPEYLKCEAITEYFDVERACDGALARVQCEADVSQRAALYALQKVRDHIVFDNDYNAKDSTQLYCTELVRNAYLSQGIDLAEDRSAEVPFLIGSGAYIFPEHLWQSRFVEQIDKNHNAFK